MISSKDKVKGQGVPSKRVFNPFANGAGSQHSAESVWDWWIASPNRFTLLLQLIRLAASLAACTAGNKTPTSTAMIAITSNSISVNPAESRRYRIPYFLHLERAVRWTHPTSNQASRHSCGSPGKGGGDRPLQSEEGCSVDLPGFRMIQSARER